MQSTALLGRVLHWGEGEFLLSTPSHQGTTWTRLQCRPGRVARPQCHSGDSPGSFAGRVPWILPGCAGKWRAQGRREELHERRLPVGTLEREAIPFACPWRSCRGASQRSEGTRGAEHMLPETICVRPAPGPAFLPAVLTGAPGGGEGQSRESWRSRREMLPPANLWQAESLGPPQGFLLGRHLGPEGRADSWGQGRGRAGSGAWVGT